MSRLNKGTLPDDRWPGPEVSPFQQPFRLPLAAGRRAGSPRRRPVFQWPAALLVLLVALAAFPGAPLADPVYEGPLIYGLDPVVRHCDDARLLGVERALMRERLALSGIDPVRDGDLRPGTYSVIREVWRRKSSVDLVRKEQVVEYNGTLGLMTIIEYPTYFFLFPARQVLAGGFVYYPPRPVDDPVVSLFLDDLEVGQRRQRDLVRRQVWNRSMNLMGGGAAGDRGTSLLNLTIPIKLPRTLEKIIGRGEKTRIKISGREHISIGGESSVIKPFIPNERVQSQSYFPSLDMKQQLQVNLSGTIGEKILIEVDHNSEAIGAEGTKIKLMYRGLEDEIINTIEAGDVGLTLPNSNLLGYSSNKSGLFGVKVTGQVGRADFTLVASKQKAESSSRTFNASGGSMEDHVYYDYQYLNNRFFFLDLPGQDNPGYAEGYRIDAESIRVFEDKGGRPQGEGDIKNVAVYLDTTGVFWKDTAIVNDFTTPYSYSQVWGEVPFEKMEDANGRLVAIDLRRQMDPTTTLAVVYQLVDGPGGTIKVGDLPGLDDATRQVIDGNPHYRMKLLKAPEQRAERYTYQYVLRNIYPLGGARIDAETFELRIEREQVGADHPEQDRFGIPYIRTFGLDQTDGRGGPSDGLADKTDQFVFDLDNGLLIFPLDFPYPFNADSLQYIDYANDPEFTWEGSSVQLGLAPEIYDPTVFQSEFANYGGAFKIISSHASAASSFSLGASNIEEGSEVVVLDGRTLVKDTDYEIDYTFGQITLKGDNAILTPSSQISVNFSYAPFIGGGKTSLMGFNVGYDLGRDSKLSTTWLYQSEAIVGEKAKLGEEPSRTLVGNVNFQHSFKPYALTHVANFISRRNSERESSVSLSGELAISLPNPNTMDKAYLEDFEGVDASDVITLTRGAWFWASAPVIYVDPVMRDNRYDPADRVPTVRWFLPKERVLRRYLNPDLEGQERDETQSSMDLYMQANDHPDSVWTAENWGGIMRGISRTGLDLSRSQFLEFWINDSVVDSTQRSGRLHIDFGYISEDGFWPEADGGGLEIGTWQKEDGINSEAEEDGVWVETEDVGLAGDEWGTQRYDASYDYDGDIDYPGPNTPFPGINGTARNRREDTEDLNGSARLDLDNVYFSSVISLRDSALVDVLRDYPAGQVDDLIAEGHAWRKYRIPLTDLETVSDTGLDAPNIKAVTHIRVWFEDATGKRKTVRLQLSDLRFLGSRWQREGVRLASDESLLTSAELGLGEEFFLGEANNKENPDYRLDPPPFEVPVLNGIEEKEQSLLLDFRNLEGGHMIRAGKQVSPRGDDYTRYRNMSWYWFNPLDDNKSLNLFFRVGSDTLNYYQVDYKFEEADPSTGWKYMKIDLARLADVKTLQADPATGEIHSTIPDVDTGQQYNVRVVGRPDLRLVKRYFFGVVNDSLNVAADGYIYLNDIKLEGVKRDVGMARRAGIRVNMADVLKIDFDWRNTDAEFHGLDAVQGSGLNFESWNFSTNFNVDDFIPILGFHLPLQLGKGQTMKRPKYQTNSDIEILNDAVADSLSSQDVMESFTTRLYREPSKSVVPRYLIDPWKVTVSGSRTRNTTPLERRQQKDLKGTLNFDLRLPQGKLLGDFPGLRSVPVIRGLSYLPSKLEAAASFTSTHGTSVAINQDGTEIPRLPTKKIPGTLKGAMDYRPASVLNMSVSGESSRDLVQETRKYGVNIGRENNRKYTTRATITVPKPKGLPQAKIFYPVRQAARGLNLLRPSIQFNSSFNNATNPEQLLPGDPPEIHSMGNGGSWDFRFTVPVGDVVKRIYPERSYSDQEKQRLVEQQRRRESQEARRTGQDQAPGTGADLGPDGEDLTPEERQRREEERLLEEARIRLDQEEEARGGSAIEAETEAGGGRPRIPLPNPFTLVMDTLRNAQPIKVTMTDRKSASYGRTPVQAGFWFKAGLDHTLDIPDSLVATYTLVDRKDLSLATTTKVTNNLSLDVKYRTELASNEQMNGYSRDYKQDWPDAQVSLSGMEKWRIFGATPGERDSGWFKGSNASLSYKRTKTVNGMTPVSYNPKITVAINPRVTFNFHNGMTATLSSSLSQDETRTNGTLTEANRFRVGAQFKHQFRAQRLLAKIGLYRPGANPTITMDVDTSFSKNTSVRTNPGAAASAATGTRQYGVTPRFTYQISRNLSSGMNFGFNNSTNIATGVSSTKISMGMEVTFVF